MTDLGAALLVSAYALRKLETCVWELKSLPVEVDSNFEGVLISFIKHQEQLQRACILVQRESRPV